MGALANDAALAALEPDASTDDDEDAGAYPTVVAESPSNFKQMTVATAVAELDSANCGVVIFRYAENQRINLVYRRADGNIGWNDPFRATNGHAS